MSKKLTIFIDTNIPIYAAGMEHHNKGKSVNLLEQVSMGKVIGLTSTEVLQEILYRYKFINLLAKGIKVFDEFTQVVDEVLSINGQIIKDARDILFKNDRVSPRDAVHVATVNYYKIDCIATFDKHFKQFKSIKYYQF